MNTGGAITIVGARGGVGAGAGALPGMIGIIDDGTMLLGGVFFCGDGGLNSGGGTLIGLAGV